MKKKHSFFDIISVNFIKLALIMSVTFALLTSFFVGQQLLANRTRDSQSIIKLLDKTVDNSESDWNHWIMSQGFQRTQNYVVVIMNSHKHVHYYYSPASKQLYSHANPVPYLKSVYYYNRTPYLYTSRWSNGIKYELLASLKPEVLIFRNFFLALMIAWIIIAIAIIIIGHHLAQKISSPLESLSQATSSATKDSHLLPVPEEPEEVHDLALNFNSLLRDLTQKNELEKIFINNATHELRTPIATIKTHIQLINRHGKQHPELIPESLGFIEDETNHMDKLINELLVLARHDASPTVHPSKIDLKKFTTDRIQKFSINKEIDLKCDQDIQISVDSESLEHILTNLISNAIKYSDDEPVTIQIYKQKSNIFWQIHNDGKVISAKDLPHIFERFYRADDVRGSIQGTGLGLSIVKDMADLNNIKIKVTSSLENGTNFTLIFDQN